jgi:hypothetical protein
MADKLTRSQNKSLLCELPFYGTDCVRDIQINSCTSNVLPTKKDLDNLSSIYDLDLFSLNTNNNINPDANLPFTQIRSNYYSPHSFSKLKASKDIPEASLSFLHNNLRSWRRNIENFQEHLLQELNFNFSIIGVTETRITQSSSLDCKR